MIKKYATAKFYILLQASFKYVHSQALSVKEKNSENGG